MKKFLLSVLCAAFSMAMMAQQSHTMQIMMKSGQTVNYNTDDVESITFTEENPGTEVFSVDFQTIELTPTSVLVTISPSDDTKYYASIWTKQFMTNPDGSWLDDKTLIKTCIPDPDFESKCHTQEFTVSGYNYLPGSELVLIVFDAAAQTGADVEVFKYAITTPDGQAQEDMFTLTDKEVGFTDVSFHAQADDPSACFMAWVLKTSDFERYGTTVMQNIYFALNNAAVDRLISISEYIGQNGVYGESDFYFDGLLANTGYTVAVFYVNPQNDDPTNVYDWNYTRWDFTTKEATSAPTIEVSDIVKTSNANGTVDISCHVKTTNAASIRIAPREASAVEPYFGDDYEVWSNLFVAGFSQLSASKVEEANSDTGTEVSWSGIDDVDYYILARATNSEGGTKTIAIKVN